MTDETLRIDVRPEVVAFVRAVRAHFADLDEDEREELLGGLEADLSDLVSDRGTAALGDPDAYAAELRSAAGFGPAPRGAGHRRLSQRLVAEALFTRDRAREFVARPKVAHWWAVLVAFRPAWWLVRAWVAAVLVARVMPGWDGWGLWWMPGVGDVAGLVIFVACLVGSVLVGVGRIWPGTAKGADRGRTAAGVLLALNLLAVLMLPVASSMASDARWEAAYREARSWTQPTPQFATNKGRMMCNIAAYDVEGNPLSGVQLFDQDGQPLELGCGERVARFVPWMLGDVPRWNVVPLARRPHPVWREKKRGDISDVTFPVPDKATVPAVTHPLVPVQVMEEHVDEDPTPSDPDPQDESGKDGAKGEGEGKGKGDRKDDAKPDREADRTKN